MRISLPRPLAFAFLLLLRGSATPAQTPTPAPASGGPNPLRIVDAPNISVLKLPAENPYGSVVDLAAALPPKPGFTNSVVPAGLFVSTRVDAAGKVKAVRRERDPVPSVSAESQRSLLRWTFEPARRAGQPVESWAAMRLDLQVEVEAPKLAQATVSPVLPSTPLPAPFEWGSDADWFENRRVAPLSDGTVPIEQVDSSPMPKRTPWSADSYDGPFAARFWVKVNSSGRVEKAIPIQVTDPVLIPYFRKAISLWTFRPARLQGGPAESWNELFLAGEISYSVKIHQIASLRKTLAGS